MKIILILLLSLPVCASAEVYQWHDTNGKAHFSDHTAEPEAKPLTIKTTQGFYYVKAVFDGDTVVLDDGQKIRLLGINTPEIAHRGNEADAGGNEAKNWLVAKLQNSKVRLETDVEKTDSYGRTLGHLFTENNEHINVLLVAAGLAQASIWPPNLKYTNELANAQQQAENSKLGIWRRSEYARIPVDELTENGHHGWTRIIGKVKKVDPAKKFVYLKFSDRFNARIEKASLSLFPDLNSYQGKTIEVRGWLNKRGDTFSMLIRHPSAIQ